MKEDIKGVVEMLEDCADRGMIIDIGRGVEVGFDLTPTQFMRVHEQLKADGYSISLVWVDKVGAEEGTKTLIPVLHSADKDKNYILEHRNEIVVIDKTLDKNAPIRTLTAMLKARHRNGLLKEIFKLVDDGVSNTEIAKKLGVGESTARNYVKNKELIMAQAGTH